MKTMKKDLFDELSQQAFKLLQAAEADTFIRELMARLYVDSLEDKIIIYDIKKMKISSGGDSNF